MHYRGLWPRPRPRPRGLWPRPRPRPRGLWPRPWPRPRGLWPRPRPRPRGVVASLTSLNNSDLLNVMLECNNDDDEAHVITRTDVVRK